jgi:hypothetical protein
LPVLGASLIIVREDPGEVNPTVFLLLNLALAFYLVGAVYAIEVDIFRSWRLVGTSHFHTVQTVHWRKLPYWVFAPLGLALIGSFVLLGYHPAIAPAWARWGNLGCQLASHLLAEFSGVPGKPSRATMTVVRQSHI